MLTVAVCLIICGALPSISTPELLLDLDESPSTAGELVGANANGMLLQGLNEDGSRSLWWTPWDGSPFLVIDRTQGTVITAPLGEGFVLFASDGAGQVQVLALTLGETPRVEALQTVPEPVRIVESSSHVWWVDPNGTSTTDGTRAGTRLVAPGVEASFHAGDSLYSQGARWTDGGYVGGNAGYSTRAGVHALRFSGGLFNELEQPLVTASHCVPRASGETAWVSCYLDAGWVMTYATDGTPAGTRARFGPQGNVLDATASGDHLLALTGAGCTLVPARDGPLHPFDFCLPGSERILGDVWLTEHSVSSLVPPFIQLEVGALREAHAAGRRAVFATQSGYRLTDGTEAGTRNVPAEWPASLVTASSSPRLLGSNGDRALYRTARGVWVTDGTREGTMLVGERAEFWGERVLATQGGSLVVFDPEGKSWFPSAGTRGVAHRSLLGQDGCSVFTIDGERRQRPIAIEGCVAIIEPGADGALIKTDLGSLFLVRDDRAFELGAGASTAEGVRCGEERCWYLGVTQTGLELRTLELANGSIEPVLELESGTRLLGDSSLGVVTELRGARSVVFRNGARLPIEDQSAWLFAPDGRLALLSSSGIDVLSDGATPPSRLHSFDCPPPAAMALTDTTLHALCDGALRSGPIEGPLTVVDAGANPALPEGDRLAWSSVVRDDQAFLRVAEGSESREFPGVRGSHFARVRAGYVFAGSGVTPDEELWVARVPPQACGCGAGSGGAPLLLALFALGRRARRPRRSDERLAQGWNS